MGNELEDKFGSPIKENKFYIGIGGSTKLVIKNKEGKLVFTGREIDGYYTLTKEIAETLAPIPDIQYYIRARRKETDWIEEELKNLSKLEADSSV